MPAALPVRCFWVILVSGLASPRSSGWRPPAWPAACCCSGSTAHNPAHHDRGRLLMIPDATWRFHGDRYVTPEQPVGWLARAFPSALFYPKIVGVVLRCSRLARLGRYDKFAWARSSEEVVGYLESSGCRIHAEGLANLDALDQP